MFRDVSEVEWSEHCWTPKRRSIHDLEILNRMPDKIANGNCASPKMIYGILDLC